MPASFQGSAIYGRCVIFYLLGRGKLGIEDLVRLEVLVDVRKVLRQPT